ncbi:MAG: hypothetical protein AAF829_04695 [Pseudomonadota bacterium]
MSKTILLTLGRLPKALEIARSLKGAGCRVLIAEPFRRHLSAPSTCIDACFQVPSPAKQEADYLHAMLDIIAREGVDIVVPISEEAMFAAGLKSRLPEAVSFFGPERGLIRSLHDKAAFVERAAALGLTVPETYPLGTLDADDLVLRSDVVIKDTYSSAGVGVLFVDRGSNLPTVRSAPALVQARLPGRARNTVSLTYSGRVIETVAYEGTVMSHTVSVAFRRIEAPDLDEWIAPFVAGTGYTGFIAFDFIDDTQGVPHAIECNPRANSGVHYLSPEGLAQAILAPGETASVGYKPEILMQQFYPCLTEAQSAMFNPSKRAETWHFLRKSKDVTWRRDDPWPFILMTFTSWNILKRAIFNGESFGEAAVADIAWNGREQLMPKPVFVPAP